MAHTMSSRTAKAIKVDPVLALQWLLERGCRQSSQVLQLSAAGALFWKLIIYLFYVYGCLACMYVCTLHVCLVPEDARRGCWIPWDCGCRPLWAFRQVDWSISFLILSWNLERGWRPTGSSILPRPPSPWPYLAFCVPSGDVVSDPQGCATSTVTCWSMSPASAKSFWMMN